MIEGNNVNQTECLTTPRLTDCEGNLEIIIKKKEKNPNCSPGKEQLTRTYK